MEYLDVNFEVPSERPRRETKDFGSNLEVPNERSLKETNDKIKQLYPKLMLKVEYLIEDTHQNHSKSSFNCEKKILYYNKNEPMSDLSVFEDNKAKNTDKSMKNGKKASCWYVC